MVYTSALAAPKRFQWETNSAPSKAENCGPTCITQIAGFYRDAYYGIEATRHLVTGSGTPTNSWQQAEMLRRRGVPCSVREVHSVAALRMLVSSGRRPVLIGMLMGLVPADVRDHPFMGWHALTVMAAPANGFWITDPNFSPPGGIRPDTNKGMKWYPDWVIQNAFINNSPRFSVIPDNLKPLPASVNYVKFNVGVNGVNMRTNATTAAPIYAVVYADPKGIVRAKDGKRIGSTGATRTLYSTVRGSDGQVYNRLRIHGTSTWQYVQARFMHRI